jgi:stage IV sporulation protein FB
MRENSSWSLNWGTWAGVRVRAHASLFGVFLVAVYLSELASRSEVAADSTVAWYGVMAWLILLASVVVHELAHFLVAVRTGGNVNLIVLGPLGGMHAAEMPREPHREVAVAMAGPVAHFLVLALLTPAMLLGGVALGDILLHPLSPNALQHGAVWIVALKFAFWINWVLLLVNLIPAPPLDAGRALRAVLWPVMGYRGANRTLNRCGMLTALVFTLLAVLLYDPEVSRLLPAWLPLMALAIYLYFASRQDGQRGDQEDEDDLFGYDFSQGYTSLERAHTVRHPGPLRRWLQQRRELKDRRLRQIEEDEERRFDGILIRIKEFGIDSLPPDDRALLQRVSARYRNRMQS